MIGDLITLAFAKTIAGIDPSDTNSDSRLRAIVSACSVAAAEYCGRTLYPGCFSELYDGSGSGWLILRTSPLIDLVSVIVGPSTANPQTYTVDDLDIHPHISRISFKPTTVANFFYDIAEGLVFPSAQNAVQANYYGGYGAKTTVAASISTGAQTVTPGAMYGISVTGDSWNIVAGSTVLIDAGQANQEMVAVTGATSSTFTAPFAFAHDAGASVIVPVIPAGLQLGVAIMVSNMHRQKDFTKQSEKLDQYAYTIREAARGGVFTPEVCSMLNRYRSAFAG